MGMVMEQCRRTTFSSRRQSPTRMTTRLLALGMAMTSGTMRRRTGKPSRDSKRKKVTILLLTYSIPCIQLTLKNFRI